ncbi:hypothetical protein [Nostoc sp.]
MQSLICLQAYLGELPTGGKRSRLCRGDRFNFCDFITIASHLGQK